MDYVVKSGAPARQRTACAIVALFDDGRLTPTARELDAASGKLISRAVKGKDVTGKSGETLLLQAPAGSPCERILLVGCGSRKAFALEQYRRATGAAVTALTKTGAGDALSYLAREPVEGLDAYGALRHGVEAAEDASYRFAQMKSGKDEVPALKRLGFAVADRGGLAPGKRGIRDGAGIAAGVALAKDLGNLPANVCTPSHLAATARDISKGRSKLSVKVVEEATMKRLGMNALLSVTQGSRQPAKLIVLQYSGAPASSRPIALVGKGITFDTGGISIKPGASMDEMKFDMCGAASVLGTVLSADRLQLPVNLVAIVPACENMPDGSASRPGDIVRSMSGQTVEILNTDAEGRLILCDALTYARRFKPRFVVDIATLTGACVIALGAHYTGLMSTDDALAEALANAGKTAEDRAWRLPLGDEYAEQLKSNFADFANIGTRSGGAITAGCFLAKFTDKLRWAHLDIAGTAWKSGSNKGATGRPVPLLTQFLMDHAA